MNSPQIIEGIVFVAILAVVGTAVAVYLFNHLIQISSPVFASSVTYFIPAIATFLGFLAGEELSYFQFFFDQNHCSLHQQQRHNYL